VAIPESSGGESRQLARYQVRPEALERCLAAVHEFVSYVRAKEPGTLRYEGWQEKFASVLYPECLAPVEFVDYRQVSSNI
jgi:hypothetical protein